MCSKLHNSDHDDRAEGALPFVWSWANKLMRLASNEAIANSSHASNLPPDIETVYELATMTAPALEAAIEAGRVTPQTTRAEAKEIKREAEGERTERPILCQGVRVLRRQKRRMRRICEP